MTLNINKIKTFLLYFLASIVIFVLIFIFANSSLGVKRIPVLEVLPGTEAIVGRWTFKTNPSLYLIEEFEGISSLDGWVERPFILLYWYFLSLLITSLLYKIIRLHQLKLQGTKYLVPLIVIIIGLIAYSVYWLAIVF